jgi:hypothetical protein
MPPHPHPTLALSPPYPSFNAKIQWIEEGSSTRGEPWSYIEPVVGCIEVAWGNGIIEKVQFPLPKDRAFLQASTKREFLQAVDHSTPERRMKAAIEMVPVVSGY